MADKNGKLNAVEGKLETVRTAVQELLDQDGHAEGELGTLVRRALSIDELQVYVSSRTNPLSVMGSKLRNAAGIPTPVVKEHDAPTEIYDEPHDPAIANAKTVIGGE